jgi:predicted PurR-regulated permease PerM
MNATPIRISTDTIIRVLLFAFLAYLLFKLTNILLLVLVSIVIASFIEAGVQLFAKYKISRTLAVPIIFTFVIALLFMIFYTFVPIIFRELSDMVLLLSSYFPNASSTPLDNQSIQGATDFVTNIASTTGPGGIIEGIKNAATALSQGAISVIGSTFGGILNLILVVVMSFYLSIQERGIDNFLRILTPAKNEAYVIDLWHRTQRKIGLWFKGQLLLGLVVGIVTSAVLSLMGIRYALLIGLITGIAELVPFGVIFATIPAALFAVIDGGIVLGIKVLIFYVIMQQIENYVLNPLVSRRVVGIPPLVVLLSFLIGITLAGFWGAIIAIPAAVFVLEYMSDVERRKLVPVTTNESPL